jgi:hypothetical protein
MRTPLPADEKLSLSDVDPLTSDDATNYRSVVGALQYLALTRPDISFLSTKFVSSCMPRLRLTSRL